MELNSETGIGLIEPKVVEVSPERLRSLLSLIETELYQSQVYQIALANLQKLLGDAAPKGEILINAVGREAIQVALKQVLVRQSNTVVQPVPNGNYSAEVVNSSSTQGEKTVSPAKKSVADSSESSSTLVDVVGVSEEKEPSDGNGVHSNSVTSEVSPISSESTQDSNSASNQAEVQKSKKRKRRLTQAELAAQAAQKREASLRQVGQELRQAREALSVSLTQLHRQTLIPLSHLRALEMGHIEELPEDVYLRGFICRLGNALGLNGTAMAASIPTPDPLQHLIPSWSKAELDSNFYLNSVHLYLGYAAILAGSLGGIAWLSQQSIPETTIPPEMQKLLQENPPQSRQNQSESKAASKPGLATSEMGVVLGADIAPPQAMDTNLTPQEMTSMGFSHYQPEG